MQKPTKQILYKPPTQIEIGKKDEAISRINTKSKKETIKQQPNNPDNSSGEKLAQWIINATLINKAALCKESEIDRGNLDKFLLKGVIPEQHINKLTGILKNYGYAE